MSFFYLLNLAPPSIYSGSPVRLFTVFLLSLLPLIFNCLKYPKQKRQWKSQMYSHKYKRPERRLELKSQIQRQNKIGSKSNSHILSLRLSYAHGLTKKKIAIFIKKKQFYWGGIFFDWSWYSGENKNIIICKGVIN